VDLLEILTQIQATLDLETTDITVVAEQQVETTFLQLVDAVAMVLLLAVLVPLEQVMVLEMVEVVVAE
jgi:rRNA processing protein Krr1/Pno1